MPTTSTRYPSTLTDSPALGMCPSWSITKPPIVSKWPSSSPGSSSISSSSLASCAGKLPSSNQDPSSRLVLPLIPVLLSSSSSPITSDSTSSSVISPAMPPYSSTTRLSAQRRNSVLVVRNQRDHPCTASAMLATCPPHACIVFHGYRSCAWDTC